MRLAFFGSDPFSLPSLLYTLAAGHEIALVVTNPDRPKGRSGAPQPTPVRAEAEARGIPVLAPEGKPDQAVAERIGAAGIELAVVVAYGQFLPRIVRAAPSRGFSINVHASLLPRWRGAAPDAAAILAGDPITGVTVQRMVARMDEGPVLARRETPIGAEETRGQLRERLAVLGAELLVEEALPAVAAGTAVETEQDASLATHAPLLEKEHGRLDLTRPAEELGRQVRAYAPWPGAFLQLESGRVQVLRAAPRPADGAPGRVLGEEGEALLVSTGRGALLLQEVKPDGKRAMSGTSWARGRRLRPGDALA